MSNPADLPRLLALAEAAEGADFPEIFAFHASANPSVVAALVREVMLSRRAISGRPPTLMATVEKHMREYEAARAATDAAIKETGE